MNRAIGYALTAALLFGASTPLAKRLIGDIEPLVLAGLLYVGSALGLGSAIGLRRVFHASAPVVWPRWPDVPWLVGAIVAGGMLGPVLLLYGLARMPAATVSLLLNLEAVLTVLLAWFAFHENVDRRIAVGMALIVAGGVVLALAPGVQMDGIGTLLVAGACLCWAVDNNLTRKVATLDPLVVAGLKGAVAGPTIIAAALAFGDRLPPADATRAALAVGFFAYGASLALFVVALRELGTARTSAYFSVAPFFGAAMAIAVLGEPASSGLFLAGALMGVGVWLHLAERHGHRHVHEAIAHTHPHRHDDLHHAHTHDLGWDGSEPHTHAHVHESVTHSHPHYPDIHHRHPH